ncbi:Cu,Zn superoxide dismutase-like protein [Podospora aff. communis PSN243]|uniref:superoxide dismutase n=1 Tax=Podospora aff. communis PSN243 TaxID=3040156 RepID=A0AAV9GUH5_9PEZI|nr:Cu,Zn superoxide dismutase-like protein [Podospora aff. communis PSN243]
MHFLVAIALLGVLHGASSQMTGKLGNAMAITNNPAGAVYTAMLDGGAMNSVMGSVTAMSTPGGKGVMFNLTLMNLPMMGGPYSYHLHDQPVASDGNCASTLAHLDPYQRGQEVACDMAAPETCEVGDLSGKHGKIDGPSAMKTFIDQYAALVPGIGAFFGNRSIVIHYANSTRLACANFTMADMDMSNMMPMPMPTKPGKGKGCD